MTTSEELLDGGFMARLERLQISTTRRLVGQFSGEHRSRHDGSSLDFSDYREYNPGDDFRRIDYHLLARLDQLVIKLFEAEDDITVRFLLDTSGSMASPSKFLMARRVVAALAFVALGRRDAVTIRTFPSAGSAPRFVGRGRVGQLLDHLLALEPGGPTDFAGAASEALARRTLPGLSIVVSDLLTPEWEQAISRLPARGDDVVVVRVDDPLDHGLGLSGDLELVDRETGETIGVSVTPAVAHRHRRRVEEWQRSVALRCRKSGAAYIEVGVHDDLETVLLRRWLGAGAVR